MKGQGQSDVKATDKTALIVAPDDRILVTGAAGFIGSRVVQGLVDRGFRNLACFTRPSSDGSSLKALAARRPAGVTLDIVCGNLLSRPDCETACKDAALILHLAAGTGEKSFPDAYMNSVVATRNLIEESLRHSRLRRFVLVSSFAVYANRQKSRVLTECSPLEENPQERDAYCYAKVKQEELLVEYGQHHGVPHVIVRPGSVYGGRNTSVTGRVGLGTFGIFLHLGGSNTVPFTYVDNCAEAIILAGLVRGVDGEAFNVVDDDLPTSAQFLREYKRHVRPFKSVYVPNAVSRVLCHLWERYSRWSMGQLPPVFSRARWYSEWRTTRYTNEKLKRLLGWTPVVTTAEGMRRYLAVRAESTRNA